jgi:hypothetical protein
MKKKLESHRHMVKTYGGYGYAFEPDHDYNKHKKGKQE